MKQQQRMVFMKDLMKKIRSRGRKDAKNRWRVSELLAEQCEKAWIHPGWEDSMQKWFNWLEDMKKQDEKRKRGRNCISTMWRKRPRARKAVLGFCTKSRSQHHGGVEHGMRGCWTVKQRGENGQNIGSAMRKCRMRRTNFGRVRN